MFINIQLPNTVLKNASSPVELTMSDINKLREHRFKSSVINNYAENVKQKRREWNDYNNEYVVALHLKEQHFNNIAKGIRSLTTAASVGIIASLLTTETPDKQTKVDNDSTNFNFIFQNLINGLANNSEAISSYIVQYIGPDFSICDESDVLNDEHKKIIVSEYRGKSLASVLQELQVPEGISSEVDDIWRNGITFPNAASFLTNSISYYFQKKKKVDKSGFGRRMKIAQENQESSDDDSDEYYQTDSEGDSDDDDE